MNHCGELGAAIWRGQHEAHFVEKGLRVVFAVEIAALEAPIGPGAGETVEHLPGRGFADDAFFFGQGGQGGFIGDRAPQEGGDGVFLDLLQARGHAGLAEIFLREHVAGDLAPGGGNFDAVLGENGRAVGIADFALGLPEFDVLIGRLARFRIVPLDPHRLFPKMCAGLRGRLIPRGGVGRMRHRAGKGPDQTDERGNRRQG